jgi:ubiquinone/menaquinone biosynthesis C-methylase UbiE
VPWKITHESLSELVMNKTSKKYEETLKTYNKLGRKYFEAISIVPPKARADFIKRLKKGSRILDIGCSGGRDMKVFTRKGFDAMGIDVSGVFLNIAKKEVPKGKFLKMDVLDLDFPEEYFQGVWADAVLHHLTKIDMPKALKNINRIISKKGILYVSVKYGQGAKLVKEQPFTKYRRFYSYYKKNEIESLLKKAGFKIIKSGFLKDDLGRADTRWISLLAKK